MAQNPLPPPPPSGGVLDGWLYLLWRRLTQTGQILWESITPGTSADVAAAVTDETGTAGSLVFSGNPTLQGLTVEDAAFTSRGITDNATATALTIDADKWIGIGATPIATVPLLIYHSTTANFTVQGDASTVLQFQRFSSDASAASINFKKARGTTASQSAVASGDELGIINFSGWGGSSLAQGVYIRAFVDIYVSTSDVSTYLTFSTRAAATGAPVEALRITSAQRVVAAKTIATAGYTVATLPAGTVGDRAYVTNALAPAYGVAVAGGGAVTIPVFYNGAAWICA